MGQPHRQITSFVRRAKVRQLVIMSQFLPSANKEIVEPGRYKIRTRATKNRNGAALRRNPGNELGGRSKHNPTRPGYMAAMNLATSIRGRVARPAAVLVPGLVQELLKGMAVLSA